MLAKASDNSNCALLDAGIEIHKERIVGMYVDLA